MKVAAITTGILLSLVLVFVAAIRLGSPPCVVGAQRACSCVNGASGIAICLPSYELSSCSCETPLEKTAVAAGARTGVGP